MPNSVRHPVRNPAIPPDPAAVHASALVIDAHADTPQRFVDESWDFTSPLAIADQPAGHLNLATARRGNLAAEFFALWPDPAQLSRRALRPPHPHPPRRRPRAGPPPSRRTRPLHFPQRNSRRPRRKQIRHPPRHRGRPRHRELPRSPPPLSRPRRPLHDPHLDQLQRLGRILRRLAPRFASSSRPAPPASPPSAARSSRR